MTAARKALEALEAAGKDGTPRPWGVQYVHAMGIVAVAQVVFTPDRIVTGNVVASLDPEDHGDDDREGRAICMSNANAIALSVNLSAPLAAVVRAVADRPWWLSDGETLCCEGCRAMRALGAPVAHDDDNVEGQVLPCRYAAADAALDAFNAAALAQGFQP